MQSEQTQIANDFELLEAPVEHGTVPCIAFGEGDKDLVLLPGLSLLPFEGSASAICAHYAAFTKLFRVYVVCRRLDISENFTMDDLVCETAQAFDELGIRNACVIGVSLGGMIAQSIAANRPDLVSRLALVSTVDAFPPSTNDNLTRWATLARNRDMAGLASAFGEKVYSPEYYSKIARVLPLLLSRATNQDIERFCTLDKVASGFKLNGRVTCETKVFAGDADQVFTLESMEQTAKNLGAEICVYENGPHAIYDECEQLRLDLQEYFEVNATG